MAQRSLLDATILRKLPGSKPGMAILQFSRAGSDIIDTFR